MSSASDSGERGRRPAPGRSLLDDAVGEDAASEARRLEYFELGPADQAALRGMRELAERTVDGVVDQFYAHLQKFDELRELLHAEPGRLDRLRGLQRAYFVSLTDAAFDRDYFAARRRVGAAHEKSGLLPVWYIGGYSLYLRLAMRRLVDERGDGAAILPELEALVKAIMLDMSLAIGTYIYGGFVTREVAAQLERSVAMAEESLRSHAETERLKDELAAMVVHDLKNPVNGISMVVQLALRKADELPEAHRRYLTHIDLTCREMMRLIQNLLEISRIEEGKMPVRLEAVRLRAFVDEVAAENAGLAAQLGRPVHLDVPEDLPPVHADRDLLRRTLVNLVVNALRHSGSRDVLVTASEEPAGAVTIRVVDRGRGIPPELQTRVFERFAAFRRTPTDEPATDSGLGLPFCKLAVEAMGGRIALESTPGSGTTVALTLPARRP